MYDKSAIQHIRGSLEAWETGDVQRAVVRLPERRDPFTTLSGAPVNRLYTPADAADLDYTRLHTGFCRDITVTEADLARVRK